MDQPSADAPRKAVLDANVLYRAPLRDLLMSLAVRDLFLPLWTEAIHSEWMRNVLEDLPHVTHERLERTKALMLEHMPNANVESYEHLIGTLRLPDTDDRHVLAAAIHASATLIVTMNLKDFPARALEQYGVAAMTPDAFLMTLVASNPDEVLAAMRAQRKRLRNPNVPEEAFLKMLERCGMLKLTTWVRNQPEPI